MNPGAVTVLLDGRKITADPSSRRHFPGERHLVVDYRGEIRVVELAHYNGALPAYNPHAVWIEIEPPAYANTAWAVATSLGKVAE